MRHNLRVWYKRATMVINGVVENKLKIDIEK
jgi:hypothetical protein